MAEVRIFSRAKSDMFNIHLYIAQDNPAEADRLADRFLKAFEQLSDFPESGNQLTGKPGYRRIVVGNYLVLYCIVNGVVQVRRVLNGATRYLTYLD